MKLYFHLTFMFTTITTQLRKSERGPLDLRGLRSGGPSPPLDFEHRLLVLRHLAHHERPAPTLCKSERAHLLQLSCHKHRSQFLPSSRIDGHHSPRRLLRLCQALRNPRSETLRCLTLWMITCTHQDQQHPVLPLLDPLVSTPATQSIIQTLRIDVYLRKHRLAYLKA